MAGSVDDVDPVLKRARFVLGLLLESPVTGRSSGSDRDPSLLLLLHPVHGSGSLVCLTNLVVNTGVIQDPLCQRRLTGVDMRHDPDIPGSLKRVLSVSHFSLLNPVSIAAVPPNISFLLRCDSNSHPKEAFFLRKSPPDTVCSGSG